MTITALITGRLLAEPIRRTGASGKPFATARLSAGTDDESVLCSVIAFGTAAEQLAALAKGDTAAITGRTKPKAWTDREGQLKAGLDVVAEQVLTAYHVRRKRAAMMEGAPQPRSEPVGRSDGLGRAFGGDPIPWGDHGSFPDLRGAGDSDPDRFPVAPAPRG